jgi:hypothetical protein
MPWQAELHDDLVAELDDLPRDVQKALATHIRLLVEFGPGLGRPSVDTLKGSRIANLKELRFSAEAGSGGPHLPSIGTGSRSCLSSATSVAWPKAASTRP